MRRPTQADVARLAKVSRSTVSMVINGGDGGRVPISEATRLAVFDAMRELGYTPNLAAKKLAGGRNRLLGIFTYEPYFPLDRDDFYYPFVFGIEREASGRDYNLLLFTRREERKPPSLYQNGAGLLDLTDGAILLGSRPDHAELRRLAAEGRPFVFIGRREVEGCALDWVSSDYAGGSREAVGRLLALGHRRLGYAAPTSPEAQVDRLAGCREACGQVPGAEIVLLSEAERRDGATLAAAVRRHALSALLYDLLPGRFASTLAELRVAGLEVPRDLSVLVLGDGRMHEADGVTFARLDLHRAEVGEAAARLLIERLEGKVDGPTMRWIPCTFVPGNSLAAPKSRSPQI